MITLGDYLIVSGILFSIGFAGVMLRRNLIIILMSLELMLNAANLSLVAFSRFRVQPTGLPDYNVQVFVFFIITVAAAEVAVGLAILVALFRARQPEILSTRIDANTMTEIIHKKESYAIIGACFEVYNEKGCGFLEPVYQECLGIELEYQLIPVIPKPSATTPNSNTNG